MRTHKLKTWPGAWEATDRGLKPFEWRRDDGRDFQVGDVLELALFDPTVGASGCYRTQDDGQRSGNPISRSTLTAQVSFVLRGQFGVPDGYCVLGLRGIERKSQPATPVDGEGT